MRQSAMAMSDRRADLRRYPRAKGTWPVILELENRSLELETVNLSPMGTKVRIKELGLALPPPSKPLGIYVPGVRVGNLLFLSGHGPIRGDGQATVRGKVGRDLSVEDGYKAAREVGVNLLGSARTLLGSLDKVKRVVKVLGMVNSAEGFGEQPKVINGFSDLMVEVFGENGRHARSAVGMAELRSGIPVEIEMILEVE